MANETPITLARKAAAVLAERGIEGARLDAELLLAAVLGVRRLDLYLQHERPLTGDELEAYRAAIRRRLRREPVQYIVGSTAFRMLELRVDRRALIPRPETELLAGVVLEFAALWSRTGRGRPRALDIGTGSGAIALSLLHEGGFETVVATDVSADALALAHENAVRLGLHERLELRHGATYEALGDDERFAVIVSNPPYIAEAERATLQPEVADYEPAAALFAAEDGLAVLHAIVAGAAARLERGGLLALELGVTQAAAVMAAIERTGEFASPDVVSDLTARPRIVTAVRSAEGRDD